MKIQVLHDNAGNIFSIFAPAEGSRKVVIETPSPDMMVIEVDAPEVTLPTDVDQGDGIAATLSYLMQHYQVLERRLVERSGKSGS